MWSSGTCGNWDIRAVWSKLRMENTVDRQVWSERESGHIGDQSIDAISSVDSNITRGSLPQVQPADFDVTVKGRQGS